MTQRMTNYFIVPGLGNSGPEHWQTYFEKSGSNFQRIEQQEWEAPACIGLDRNDRQDNFRLRFI